MSLFTTCLALAIAVVPATSHPLSSGRRNSATELPIEALDSPIEARESPIEVAEPAISDRGSSIWQPKVGDTWQIEIQNPLDASRLVTPKNVSIYDIDLFTNPTSTITALRSQPLNKRVICYFSAGSYEPYRPDSSEFTAADLGNELDGWSGEYWLNLNSANVRNIMVNRLKLAKSKGCDGVDPDNTDGYENDNGLGLTEQDSINYVTFLAAEAASLGLAIGLKNTGDIIGSVLSEVQYAINEQCIQYEECSTWSPFISAGKPVFHIEYPKGVPHVSAKNLAKFCPLSGRGGTKGFSSLLKTMDLDGRVEYCNGQSAVTAMNTN